MIKDDEYYSTKDLSKILGLSQGAIYMARLSRRLKSEKINKKWQYSGKDVKEYLKNKYNRLLSIHKGRPVFSQGEYSIKQIAEMFEVTKEKIYYIVREFHAPCIRKGSAYVLNDSTIKFIENNRSLLRMFKKFKGKIKLLPVFLFCLLLNGCTYNISMAHTEGTASDVIDDTQSNTPDISPTVTIPLTKLPATASKKLNHSG